MVSFHRRYLCSVCLALLGASTLPAGDPLVLQRVFVKRIADVELAAPKAGLLAKVSVAEGASVSKDQPLAKLDDRNAQIDLQRAKIEYEVAVQELSDRAEIELAQKRLEAAEQARKQFAIENDAAHRLAENRLAVQATEKSAAVAKNELDRAQHARNEFADSVSESEIEGLALTYQQAELESQQAEFQRQQDLLAANASDEALLSHRLAAEQASIELQQTKTDLQLARLNADLYQNALDAAQLQLAQHQVQAPFDGVVVELYRQQGEWVKPGDPIVRVLRLDRLRVEGFLPTHLLRSDLVGSPAEIHVVGFAKQSLVFQGEVSFVSPEVDAVNNEVAIWAEFDNPELLAWPGMQGTLTIHLPLPDTAGKSPQSDTEETPQQ
ncbi:putative efflux pump membrane fusion protein [Rosistilla oblonga]|uniref:HlyD family secretion protein n=1 Tax=Rosistilla oblonga TaxID=2527990 RepID=UPI00118A961E|nr:HlyD family efflux transporter periplasmic adaptor subunit [Rosistilla oblonga]QDV11325.1 putative efflux pump membrane fusion protein [Rosistilla oblonga]